MNELNDMINCVACDELINFNKACWHDGDAYCSDCVPDEEEEDEDEWDEDEANAALIKEGKNE